MSTNRSALLITFCGVVMALAVSFVPPQQRDTFLNISGAIATGGIGIFGTHK